MIFFHNEGYSTACGHGTIALITWAIEAGRIEAREPVTEVGLDVPSGRLACRAQVADGKVESVEFTNVPAYVEATDLELPTSRGPVHLDVAFGGAFYGSLEARRVGLDVSPVSLPALIALERELRRELDEALGPTHPDEPELRGTYGIIYWQTETAEDGVELVQRNVTVFADGEVDRSPCGSGTSARLALLDASGELPRGRVLRHRSIVDSVFHGRVIGDVWWPISFRAYARRPTVGHDHCLRLRLSNRYAHVRARPARQPRHGLPPALTLCHHPCAGSLPALPEGG